MRAFLAGRDRDGRASRRLQQAREWVDGQSSTKMDYWEVRRKFGFVRCVRVRRFALYSVLLVWFVYTCTSVHVRCAVCCELCAVLCAVCCVPGTGMLLVQQYSQ